MAQVLEPSTEQKDLFGITVKTVQPTPKPEDPVKECPFCLSDGRHVPVTKISEKDHTYYECKSKTLRHEFCIHMVNITRATERDFQCENCSAESIDECDCNFCSNVFCNECNRFYHVSCGDLAGLIALKEVQEERKHPPKIEPPTEHKEDWLESLQQFQEYMTKKLEMCIPEKGEPTKERLRDCPMEYLEKRMLEHVKAGNYGDASNFLFLMHQKQSQPTPTIESQKGANA